MKAKNLQESHINKPSKKSYLLICILLLSGFSFNVCADIYKWVDKDGRLHYSDKPSDETVSKKLDININSYTSVTTESLSPNQNSNHLKANPKKVVMYSTAWCGYCKKARIYFKKNRIQFVEYDIENNAKAKREYNALKATGVPVILVGNRRMNGFNEERFVRFYKKI